MTANKGLQKFISLCKNNKIQKILDIGAGGKQTHTKIMKKHGLNVFTCDYNKNSNYIGDFNNIVFKEKFDGIWCSHTLEHQLNVNYFLEKINEITHDNGIVCITVPPSKSNLVSRHVTLWNTGLLIYNLILARFDCREAIYFSYGYNISVIFRKRLIQLSTSDYTQRSIKGLINFFPIDFFNKNNKGEKDEK